MVLLNSELSFGWGEHLSGMHFVGDRNTILEKSIVIPRPAD